MWKYCCEMQANEKKGKRLKETDDRDDGPSDTFNSMLSKVSSSDKNYDHFI